MRELLAILFLSIGIAGVIVSLWLSNNDTIPAFVVGQLGGLWMVIFFVAAHKTLYKW